MKTETERETTEKEEPPKRSERERRRRLSSPPSQTVSPSPQDPRHPALPLVQVCPRRLASVATPPFVRPVPVSAFDCVVLYNINARRIQGPVCCALCQRRLCGQRPPDPPSPRSRNAACRTTGPRFNPVKTIAQLTPWPSWPQVHAHDLLFHCHALQILLCTRPHSRVEDRAPDGRMCCVEGIQHRLCSTSFRPPDTQTRRRYCSP